ncbi:MAG: acetoin utilization protein AcuC [Candidatus Thorarchaeota archaeon]|nr:MAG: acetoin utilization protein AcuC [Candidatus Thorarchaeota archaeon]
MKGKLLYPYSDSLLHYEFRTDHPLKPDRLSLTYELSRQLGLLEDVQVIEPIPATREELEMFHSPEFIDAVEEAGRTLEPAPYYGLGTADNPLFSEIYDAASRYVGATLVGAKEMLKNSSNAFCISGGLHHAQRSKASGFCVFNDIVAAILQFREAKSSRVLYVDIDAHHGDGVQNAFYRSKDVMTISLHQTGRTLFPGTGDIYEAGEGEGFGYSVNIPLLPGAGSPELLRVLEEVVQPLFAAYRPDLLVTQLGVDAHFLDPLANLTFTSHGYERVVKSMKDLAKKHCSHGWLALGGGGYHPVNVARLWSLFLAEILGKKIPRSLPEEFVRLCESKGYSNFPENMRDEDEVIQAFLPREMIQLDLDRVIRKIQEDIFPYHGM